MKVFYTLLILLVPFFSFSQLPDGTIAPNFTTSDMNGNEHQLYDYLDMGYTVILDISATWAGPCWSYLSGGTYEEIWAAHGPAGLPGVNANTTDDVMILWFEGDPNTPESELENSALGNWLEPYGEEVHFPIINDNNIADLYALPYWPIIYTICPNRILTESGQASASNHYSNLDNCLEAYLGTNAALLNLESTIQPSGCEASASGNLSVIVQNMGTELLTTFTVEVMANGQSIASESFNGSLNVFETTTIDFDNLTIDSETIEIMITSNDANSSDNSLTESYSFFSGETESEVSVVLLTDDYASETYIEITDENGNIIWSEGNENVAGNYDTGQENPPADPTDPLENNQSYEWEVSLLSTGCYTLTVGDYFGDGLFASQWGGTNGNWTVNDHNGASIAQMNIANFEGSDHANFLNTYTIINGCTDPQACNFSVDANTDDGSCNYPSNSEIYFLSCDNILWNGMFLVETGLYSYVTTNSNGCDSTVFLDFTIFESIDENIIYGNPEPDPFSVSLYSASNNGNNLVWLVDGGNIIENNGSSINIQWGNQGIGLITLVESNDICDDFTNVYTVNIGGQIEPTWDCNANFACIEQTDGSGNFQSLEECEANCSSVEPTWDCNDNFACIEQSDGSGNFQSLEECEANCSSVEPTWDCNDNFACIEQTDGSGNFQSLEECEANCSSVESTWDCNDNFACIEQTDGSGNFQSLEACEANCSLVEPTWDCNANFACIEQSDGSGNFQSLEECEANCSVNESTFNCIFPLNNGDGYCDELLDGTGEFLTLNDCEQECQNVSSINENIIDVNIFPNPSSNIFNLEFNSDSETEILVTNVLGEQVYFESTKSNGEFNTQIDLSDYSKGIYNLTIKTSDGLSNHKLILQ